MKLSANPSDEWLRGLEYEIGSLPIGTRFVLWSPTEYLHGELRQVTPCRAIVHMRERSYTSLPLECPVLLDE